MYNNNQYIYIVSIFYYCMNYLIKEFKSLVDEESENIRKGLDKIGYNLNGELKY